LTTRQIGKICKVNSKTIFYFMKKYDIPRRKSYPPAGWKHTAESIQKIRIASLGRKWNHSQVAIEKIRAGKIGNKNPSWKGGIIVSGGGYRMCLAHGHPAANEGGYVFEHRLMMERKLGRYLRPEEVVHHWDLDVKNNDPSNLILFENGQDHLVYHRQLNHLFEHWLGA